MSTPENDPLFHIKNDLFTKIDGLEEKLLKQDPMLPGHLKAIHQSLIKYEELAHLLSDDQIRKLIKAQKQHTGTVLVKATASKKTASITKQARGISASDL